jgi:arsenate reductase
MVLVPSTSGQPGMTITLYHNPGCGTSRNVLAVLERVGRPFTVVEYLKDPPDRATLEDLLHRLRMRPGNLARRRGTPFAGLGLAEPGVGDDAILAAMLQQPVLINRPIVVSDAGAVLARPSDLVFDLVPPPPGPDLVKQDGSPFLVDAPVPAEDPALAAALAGAGLTVADLAEDGTNRVFFAYATTGRSPVGHGGLELLGEDALVRSLAIRPEARGRRAGAAALAILLRRAFGFGARRAWLLTTDAAGFFGRAGFVAVAREEAPAAVRGTAQFRTLCPASATLMGRAIEP